MQTEPAVLKAYGSPGSGFAVKTARLEACDGIFCLEFVARASSAPSKIATWDEMSGEWWAMVICFFFFNVSGLFVVCIRYQWGFCKVVSYLLVRSYFKEVAVVLLFQCAQHHQNLRAGAA